MDDSRRMVTIVAVTVASLGAFYAYTYLWGPESSTTGAGTSAENADAANTGEPESGTAEEPTEPDSQRPAVDPASRLAQQRTAVIETDDYRAVISNLNGGVTRLEMLRERYEVDDEPGQMVTTDQEAFYPFALTLSGVAMPPDAVWEIEQVSPTVVRLTWAGDGFAVVRTLMAGTGPYQLWSTLRIRNDSGGTRPVRPIYTTAHYVTRDEEDSSFFIGVQSPKLSHGICVYDEEGDDEVVRVNGELGMEHSRLQPHGHGFGPDVVFAGVENSFFANVMAANGTAAERCQLRASARSLFEARLLYPRVDLAAGEQQQFRTLAYIGPKDNDALHAAGHGLTAVVDLGWFSVVATWLVVLLRMIYGYVGNWGLAIIVMTILIRIVMFPLTWKSFQSIARMRVLKPEMDRINELYADEREKKGAAIMELYRKHKINPLGGCLPQLLQMPVWFAFYASLSTNVELYHADFALWWTDLSAPDPYYSLPLLLGALMHFQQRITPTAMDPMQQKMMMYFMPVMITGFMLFLPAGLCLYMVTNSVLGIGQQQWIHHSLEKKAPVALAAGEMNAGDDEGPGPSDDALAAERHADASSIVSRTKPRSKKPAKRRTRRARS
jgi:YidC/Oxa1 family membrane protein insertase